MRINLVFIFVMAGLLTTGVFDSLEAKDQFNHFNQAKYQSDDFDVSKKTFDHGDVSISIVQVKNDKKKDRNKLGWYCRAWLNIEKDGKIINQFYFHEIEPLGYSYGLFVPKAQPSPKYFMVLKIGDYDGVLFLIGTDGSVKQLHGGRYFFAKDSTYLFSEYSSDGMGIIDVFDFKTGKLVFSNTRNNQIPYFNAYQKGISYFYTKAELASNGNDEVENKTKIIYFDFLLSKFIEKKVGENYLKDAQPIKYVFNPGDYQDCSCEATAKK